MARSRASGRTGSREASGVERPSSLGRHQGSSRAGRESGGGLRVLGGLLVALTIAVAVGVGMWRFVTTTDRFSAVEFRVQGGHRFSAGRLAEASGIARGENLFAIDLEAAQSKLVNNPWIETARVSRKLPDTIEFEIREHVAEGLLLIGDTLYLVTREGEPILELGPEDSGDLPVVTGVSSEDVVADRARALERVARGLELIRRYQRHRIGKTYPPHEVHMAADGSVELVVGARGTTLKLGQPPFAQKLLMGGRILGRILSRGEVPSIIFLDNEAHPERVVVRLR